MKAATHRQMPSMLAYFLMLSLALLSWKAAKPQNVIVKGEVVSDERILSRPTVTIIQADGQRMPLTVRASGRFCHEVKQDDVLLLLVRKPGCVDKVVRIDTRFADKSPGDGDRIVEFEVHLATADGNLDEHYADAVGFITFHHSNGRMKVTYNYAQCDDESISCLAL